MYDGSGGAEFDETDKRAVERSQACREGCGRSMDKFSFGSGCVGVCVCVGGWGTSSNSLLLAMQTGSAHIIMHTD